MTPGARVAAAIELLDDIRDGRSAEQALTAWARRSRFAGSKDRAMIRDHVFDVLRARRSLGEGKGRSLMIRLALREGWDLPRLFNGVGHSPLPLTQSEEEGCREDLNLSPAARCDMPDWLWPAWKDSLGDDAEVAAMAQQGRAPVFLRVNRRRGSVGQAVDILARDDITVEQHTDVPHALRITENVRRLKNSQAFLQGLVELQDASSQFAIQQVAVPDQGRLLDYCAGGGGKALGFADRSEAAIFAHDIAPERMRDLPARARRAGVIVDRLAHSELGTHAPFDVVFCDAPCSGSGTWRRTPDAKWRLTEDRLTTLHSMQDSVLKGAAPLVAERGILAYATCSVLKSENEEVVKRFLRKNTEWAVIQSDRRLPNADGDGFFLTQFMRR